MYIINQNFAKSGRAFLGEQILNTCEQILNTIGDTYKFLNSTVGKMLPLSNLTAITTTLLGLLIPVAISLQKTPRSNAVEMATIQNRVINFRVLGKASTFVCIAFLLWEIRSVRILLLIAYFIGVYLIIKSLIRSIKWMSDWNEEPQTGFRSRQQEKLLKKSKLTVSQRKLVWESNLKKITGIENKNSGQPQFLKGFLDGFKENYKQFDGQDRSWMINTTFMYSNLAYKKTNWYDGSFLNHSLKFTLELICKRNQYVESSLDNISNEDYNNLLYELVAWKTSIKKTFKLLVTSGPSDYLLEDVVEKNTKYAATKEAKQFLAQLILDSLYESNNPQSLNYGSHWQIDYQSLSNDKDRENTYWTLLIGFLDRIEQEDLKNYNIGSNKADPSKNGLVFESIFKNADPIFFSQLITIFFSLKTGVFFNDPAYIRYKLLINSSMEYYWSEPIIIRGNLTNQKIDEGDAIQHQYKEINTLKILMPIISLSLKDDTSYNEYITKIQEIFNVILQEKGAVSDTDQYVLKEKIEKLRATINRVATLRKEVSSS